MKMKRLMTLTLAVLFVFALVAPQALAFSFGKAPTSAEVLKMAEEELERLTTEGILNGDLTVETFCERLDAFKQWKAGSNGSYVHFCGCLGVEVENGEKVGLGAGTVVYPVTDILSFDDRFHFYSNPGIRYVSFGGLSDVDSSAMYVGFGVLNKDGVLSVDSKSGGDILKISKRDFALKKVVAQQRNKGLVDPQGFVFSAELDALMVKKAVELGLIKTDWLGLLPYIIAAVLLVLVIVTLVLVLVRRKSAAVCPQCGTALVDGECPVCSRSVAAVCSVCGSPLMADGRCPNGCVVEPKEARCPSCGSPLAADGSCPNGCGVERCPTCNSPLFDGQCPEGHTIVRCEKCNRVLVNGVCPVHHDAAEVCPTCGSELMDGQCPRGHTIVRCPQCNAIMVNGACPNGHQAADACPTCGSELVDDQCPNGHTILRCAQCNAILLEGLCPNLCDADPLVLGWPGTSKPEMTPFALEIVGPSEYAGFKCPLPKSVVLGRSEKQAKEPFIVPLFRNERARKKGEFSRRYVLLTLNEPGTGFIVRLQKTTGNSAWVAGRKLTREGDEAPLAEGAVIKLNPDYELKLVRM